MVEYPFPSPSPTEQREYGICQGCIAQWPPMKTPRWRIDRVADLLSNYLKFKVAHLRGAFSLCYIYKDNGGGTASCKLYYIYIENVA